MDFSLQPTSLLPLPGALESKGFALPALQQALSTQPSLASQAATQVFSSDQGRTSGIGQQNPIGSHTEDQIQKVSKDFEAIFLRMIFKQMRESVEKSSLFGNSRAMDFFESMRDEQLADSLAKAGGLGIGNMVYQRLQEATAPQIKIHS